MSLKRVTTTAKAVSAVTWAVESTGRLIGRGGKAFINAVRNKPYYYVEIISEGGEVAGERHHQTKDDIKDLLNAMDTINNCKIIISSEAKND